MANEDDLDLNSEEDESEGSESGGGNSKLIIIIAVVILLAGGAAAFFFMGGDKEASDAETVDEVAAETETEEEVIPEEKGEAIYIGIPNGILAQIPSGRRMMTLQVQLDMRVRSPEAAAAVKKHMPLIENDLLMFFSSANAKEIRTLEGKTKLREGALKAIQTIMKKETGKPMVELVLFSGFVMQQ